MTTDLHARIVNAAAARKKELTDQLEHGFDSDDQELAAATELRLIEQHETDTDWENSEDVATFAALVEVD